MQPCVTYVDVVSRKLLEKIKCPEVDGMVFIEDVAASIRRIRYSTAGILQYISPSLVFLTAVMTFLVIPFGPGLVGQDLNIGVLYLDSREKGSLLAPHTRTALDTHVRAGRSQRWLAMYAHLAALAAAQEIESTAGVGLTS